MKIFNLRVRPEVEELRYWVHLVIISATILGLLELYKGGMLSIGNVLFGAGLVAVGDIFAHTVLGLD